MNDTVDEAVDEAAKEVSPPIEVSKSLVTSQLAAGTRVLIILLSGATAIMGFVGTRDLAGFILWVQGTNGVAFIAAAVSIGTFLASQLATRKNKAEKIVLADAVDNSIGYVKP